MLARVRDRLGRSPSTQRRLAVGVVGLVGLLAVTFHLLHLLAEFGKVTPLVVGTVGLTLAVGVLLLPAAARLRSHEPADALTVASWTLLGLATFAAVGSLILLYQASHGVRLAHPSFVVVAISTGGAAIGYLLGLYGTARQRAGTQLRLFHSRLTEEQRRFEALFANLQNPCLYFEMRDDVPVFRAVNPAFEAVFGYPAEELLDEPVNCVVVPAGRQEEAVDIDTLLSRGESVHREVRRRTANGPRDFLLHAVPFDGSDPTTGFALVVDVTEHKRQVTRLQVLNRVLRHDLKNDMNIVLGYAAMLAEDLDDPRAVTIYDAARDIVELGDTARQIEESFRPERTPERFALGALARETAALVGERIPDADVSVTVDAEVTVHANAYLGVALEEVIENAVEHNDRERPSVAVRVTADADHVSVRVEDDGPGLPPLERAVLRTGSESQLSHSRGLGLWLVRWVVEDSGGDLVVEDRDPRGTAVSLIFPRA